MLLLSKKKDWFGNVRADILAGCVVALALIPEAIAFSIIAGVDPKVGLYASFCIAVVSAIAGGRPGMISAATGAMALLMTGLIRDHGLQYLLAATMLTGVIQLVAGYLRLGELMRFVSKAVVTGFVNALAILIFIAQLPELTGVTWHVYAVTAAGLAIIYLFPLINKTIPSPLIAILVLTGICFWFKIDIRTVGDMGELPDALPMFLWPEVPLNLETLKIILPYSIPLAMVGLLESLMTSAIVDDLTDTDSDRNRECKGQGLANVVSGLFGGMAGCAMIGQSVINVKSGGRGRLSTLFAGVLLLIMVVFLSDFVSIIPMAALVAVMIMVSIGTFSWESLREARRRPLSTNLVIFVTVVVVVWTHNLALGVVSGVLLAALFFANKIGRYLYVESNLDAENRHRCYDVVGQVFFASSSQFVDAFDFREALNEVTIDLSRAHFWDISAVGALDKTVIKFRRNGSKVNVIGLNQASETIVDRFGSFDKPEHLNKVLGGH
jgi:SulP family sulfate permease